MKVLSRWKVESLAQLQFGPSDKTLMVAGAAGVRLYDSFTGQAISEPIAGPGRWADFSPDGDSLIQVADGQIRAWKLSPPSLLCDLLADSNAAYWNSPVEKMAGAAFTENPNQIVVVPSLATFRRQADFLRVLDEQGKVQTGEVKPQAWVDRGRCLISATPGGQLKAQALHCTGLDRNHDFPASAATLAPRAVLFHQQSGVQLLEDGRLHPLGPKKASLLALRSDGSKLAVAVDKRVDLYRLEGEAAFQICHWRTQQKVERLFWLEDRVLSGTSSGTFCHDLESKELFHLEAAAVAVAPDAGNFCTLQDGQLTLHSPDGSRIAARDDSDLPLYSPDGSVLAIKSGQRNLLLLEPSSLRPLTVSLQHRDEIVTIAFDAKSQRILVCTENGELRQWPVGHPNQEPFSQIEARTRRLCPGRLDPATGTFLPL
jgi:WD40 repeat protein